MEKRLFEAAAALTARQISHRQGNGAGASWSGMRNGRVLYMRAVPLCADEAAFFRLEYGKAEKRAYDAVVARMVKEFGSETTGVQYALVL